MRCSPWIVEQGKQKHNIPTSIDISIEAVHVCKVVHHGTPAEKKNKYENGSSISALQKGKRRTMPAVALYSSVTAAGTDSCVNMGTRLR